LDEETLAQIATLVERSVAAQAKLSVALVSALLRIWQSADPYDGASVSAASAQSVVVVAAAMRRARVLASTRSRYLIRQAGGQVPSSADVGKSYPRGGANIYDVWNRPAEQFRYIASQNPGVRLVETVQAEVKSAATQVSSGGAATRLKASDPAIEALVARVIGLAEMELQLAARDEEQRVARATPGVTYLRRIIHPELSKTGTCGLCIAAASRVYKVKELAALHDGCHCTFASVIGDLGGAGDPGFFLNQADLDRLYAAAGSTYAAELSKLRFLEVPHGELGQILVPENAKDRFDPLTTRYRDADDSSAMWQTVAEIAAERVAAGGSDAIINAHKAMAATALSYV